MPTTLPDKKTLVDVASVVPSPEALKAIPAPLARRFGILPVALQEETLQVVTVGEDASVDISQVEARTGFQVEVLEVKARASVKRALAYCYPETIHPSGTPLALFEEILNRSLLLHSSDIHLNPGEDYGSVKLRVDGVTREDRQWPMDQFVEVVSSIKVAASLDIAERRAPQDGQISMKVGDEELALRVATIPTIHGEKVTLRILATAAIAESLTELSGLGMSPRHDTLLRKTLDHPHGVILLSGPTGSGKTTTLYAALRHLRQPGTQHIISIEDPVEIPVRGINQVHIDSAKVDFNRALRSTLRHDPDIIMIGEIRDGETADIAIKSALTGHLVLSTLHANDAVGVITRLLNLGVASELVASSLRLVIAQRLVRKPCPHCVQYREPTAAEGKEFGWTEPVRIPVAKGCSFCGGTGYSGRMGLYEMAPMDAALREAVLKGASHEAMARHIFEVRGFSSLLDDGADKIAAGLTTIEEVRRVAFMEGLDG
jgi:type IV pilus assembly protein PilB